MIEVDGIPVEQTENGGLVTKRGRWGINPDRDHFPRPGDRIRWCPALSMEPRYIEHLTRFTEGVEEQPLTVHVLDPEEPVQPCTFCTHKHAVAERGIIDSDYELRTEDGDLVAYTCHACIGDAPRPAEEYDLEEGDHVHYDTTGRPGYEDEFTGVVTEVKKDQGRAVIDVDGRDQDHVVKIDNLTTENDSFP